MNQGDGPALKSLALLAQGDRAKDAWRRAHELVQDEADADAAWVHAHLHRIEGDLANAAYWYRRAGKPMAHADLEDERRAIEAALRGA